MQSIELEEKKWCPLVEAALGLSMTKLEVIKQKIQEGLSDRQIIKTFAPH